MDEALVRERLKALRIAANMSQDELAEKVNLSRNSIGNLETGKTRIFYENLSRIAEALGSTADELIAAGCGKKEWDGQGTEGQIPYSPLQPSPYEENISSKTALEDIHSTQFAISAGCEDRIDELIEENKQLNKDLEAEKENNRLLRELINRYKADNEELRHLLDSN